MHIVINSLSIIILAFSAICLCDRSYIMFSVCLLIGTVLQILNEYFVVHKLVQPSKNNTYKILKVKDEIK